MPPGNKGGGFRRKSIFGNGSLSCLGIIWDKKQIKIEPNRDGWKWIQRICPWYSAFYIDRSNTANEGIKAGKRIIRFSICRTLYSDQRMGMAATPESSNGLG